MENEGLMVDNESIYQGQRITAKWLKKHCKDNGLYQTPRLNEVLYLHFQGFKKIEGLEQYTGLRCLWLEHNSIEIISNLDNQAELRSLFLQNNRIRRIEGLQKLSMLATLDLSHNLIENVENLGSLEHLTTLRLSHNKISCVSALEGLTECASLSVLDLSENNISDPGLLQVLSRLGKLRVLYVYNNPVQKVLKPYRKQVILACIDLTFLDDQPVFVQERFFAEAWKRGGEEEEKLANQKWEEEKTLERLENVQGVLQYRKDKGMMNESTSDSIPELEKISDDTETPKLEGQDQRVVDVNEIELQISP